MPFKFDSDPVKYSRNGEKSCGVSNAFLHKLFIREICYVVRRAVLYVHSREGYITFKILIERGACCLKPIDWR
jgi:hypothetical protein